MAMSKVEQLRAALEQAEEEERAAQVEAQARLFKEKRTRLAPFLQELTAITLKHGVVLWGASFTEMRGDGSYVMTGDGDIVWEPKKSG